MVRQGTEKIGWREESFFLEVELSYEPSCPLVIWPVGWLVCLYAFPKRAGSYTSMLLSDHLFTEGLRRNHGPVQEPVEV